MPVDFGIMGRLDQATRCYLAEMLVAFLPRDYARSPRCIPGRLRAGRPVARDLHPGLPGDRRADLRQALNEISFARLLGQLLRVTENFEMAVQPQLLLLQKTMLMAEGMGRGSTPTSTSGSWRGR